MHAKYETSASLDGFSTVWSHDGSLHLSQSVVGDGAMLCPLHGRDILLLAVTFCLRLSHSPPLAVENAGLAANSSQEMKTVIEWSRQLRT